MTHRTNRYVRHHADGTRTVTTYQRIGRTAHVRKYHMTRAQVQIQQRRRAFCGMALIVFYVICLVVQL